MDLEVSVGQRARYFPLVESMSVKVELDEAKRSQIGQPDRVIVDDQVERQREAIPRRGVLDPTRIIRSPVDVDPATRAVERKDSAFRTDGDCVNAIELPGSVTLSTELAEIAKF